MSTQFKNWADNQANAVLSATEFANNEDVVNGFKGGNPASAKNTNSGLRQANLFATGAMEALAEIQSVLPVDNLDPHIINDRGTIDASALSLTSPVNTIKDFVKLPYNSLARRVSVNEGVIGNDTSGLVKQTNDNTVAIGNNTSGLIKNVNDNTTDITNLNNKVSALETTVGNSSSGLVQTTNTNTSNITTINNIIKNGWISGRNNNINAITSQTTATSISMNVFAKTNEGAVNVDRDYYGIWQLFFRFNLSFPGSSSVCSASVAVRVHGTANSEFNQTFKVTSVNNGASYLRCVITEFDYENSTTIRLTMNAYLDEGVSGTISTTLVSCVAKYLGSIQGTFPI